MPEGHELLDEDEQHLAKLGYAQELHRSWSGFSNFAISFSIISILAGCFTSFGLGWNNGGPAAIAWGWPILAAFILLIASQGPPGRIRAAVRNGMGAWLDAADVDIITLQEVRATAADLADGTALLAGKDRSGADRRDDAIL